MAAADASASPRSICASGARISILGDQRFPMASTSKVAIAATFLAGVDQGRWSLTSEYPLMVPIRSGKYSSTVAAHARGQLYLRPAPSGTDDQQKLQHLYRCACCRSSADRPPSMPICAAPGSRNFELTRNIATLVRDDGEFDPVVTIDPRDSASPNAMVTPAGGYLSGQTAETLHPQRVDERDARDHHGQAADAICPANVGEHRAQDRHVEPDRQRYRHFPDAGWPCHCPCHLCHRPKRVPARRSGQQTPRAQPARRSDRRNHTAKFTAPFPDRTARNYANAQYGSGG